MACEWTVRGMHHRNAIVALSSRCHIMVHARFALSVMTLVECPLLRVGHFCVHPKYHPRVESGFTYLILQHLPSNSTDVVCNATQNVCNVDVLLQKCLLMLQMCLDSMSNSFWDVVQWICVYFMRQIN